MTPRTGSAQLGRLTGAIDALSDRPLRAVQLADILGVTKSTALRLLKMIDSPAVYWVQLKSFDRLAPSGRTERFYSVEQKSRGLS